MKAIKLSPLSMRKLGFTLYEGWGQHKKFINISFYGLPNYEQFVGKIFQQGRDGGKVDAQDEIKKVLGIDY